MDASDFTSHHFANQYFFKYDKLIQTYTTGNVGMLITDIKHRNKLLILYVRMLLNDLQNTETAFPEQGHSQTFKDETTLLHNMASVVGCCSMGVH